MNGKTYAYLDLAALPAVGAALLDPRPAFVFRGDGSGVLWANAAGVAYFGEPAMGALLERRFSPSNPLAQSLARLAKSLPADDGRLEILRFNFGVRQATLPSLCRRLDLGSGARGVLAVGAANALRESLSTRAERLADSIAAEDCLVAVFDRDGKVLGASGGFDALAPASSAIDALVGEAERGSRPVARASLAVDGFVRPAGVARVTVGDERLFLLIVGPEAAAPTQEPVGMPADPVTASLVPHEGLPAEPSKPAAAPPADHEPTPAGPQPPATPVRRFLWQTDADHVITFLSGVLAEQVGAANAPVVGTAWRDLAERLALDPDGRLVSALSALASFAGLTVCWPVAGAAERMAVDLTAVATFARDGAFAGYRGFGVVRSDDRRPGAQPAPPATTAAEAPVEATTPEPGPTPPAAAAGEESGPPQVAEATLEVEPPQVAEITPEPEPPAIAAEQPPVRQATAELDDLDDAARESVEGGGRESAPVVGAEASPTEADEPAASSNVVHIAKPPTRILPRRLSGTEQEAFRRIAEALGERSRTDEQARRQLPPDGEDGAKEAVPAPPIFDTALLDKLPVGFAVYRDNRTLFANRTLLDLLGYRSRAEFIDAGGAEAIFPDRSDWSARPLSGGRLYAARRDGTDVAVDAKLHAVMWGGATALMLSLIEAGREPGVAEGEAASVQAAPADDRIRELEVILDTATDGVVVIDGDGLVDGVNRAAEALFGVEAGEVNGEPFTSLLAEESRKAALDYLDGLASNGVASVLNDGREVIGKVPRGGLIPLFMTMGRLGDSGKYCAVLRDITHWKNVEEELVAARRAAETANAQKSDFLAKISHEIRTPLNAIIGFSEVMMAERFGPIGNDRYRNYLRDIHLSGEHLMSLINDLLDLSKVEAGKLDMNFESVAVNEVIQECVALMQPQANRERIIIRTSLAAGLPNVVADLRSVRQILLNLLSNAVKFTHAGGQVIVATAMEQGGEVVVRIRDTGIGMSEKDIDIAMKPFRQVATSGRVGEGTGLGLPLTKALVEANRAAFSIDSVPSQGTLVRITFPTTRVLAG
jgi:PAS domain S-box-containing protein